jgi:hypothetical protein
VEVAAFGNNVFEIATDVTSVPPVRGGLMPLNDDV